MASSLSVKRFLSSGLLSNSLLRPAASSASRSFNTSAMRQYDELFDDSNIMDAVCRPSFSGTCYHL
ncbi:hypothetical protein MtrunA17_Chr7g0265181 [Medicago truncatula]|uniref:Uncharacterized protein n=1 Tax=Medicago truncatula TaxID=3880 RepID=A0A396H5N7_MEDTR|nr:hypothetical protein MtrunA17_Chr7g0265181 [Medicago truncatula]